MLQHDNVKNIERTQKFIGLPNYKGSGWEIAFHSAYPSDNVSWYYPLFRILTNSLAKQQFQSEDEARKIIYEFIESKVFLPLFILF